MVGARQGWNGIRILDIDEPGRVVGRPEKGNPTSCFGGRRQTFGIRWRASPTGTNQACIEAPISRSVDRYRTWDFGPEKARAAGAFDVRKTSGHLSYRVANRRQPSSPQGMIAIRLRRLKRRLSNRADALRCFLFGKPECIPLSFNASRPQSVLWPHSPRSAWVAETPAKGFP